MTGTTRTISLADQAPAAPVVPPRLPIRDVAVVDGRGAIAILTTAGEIWTQVPYSGWNRGEALPEWQWERITAPAGKLTRIMLGRQGVIHVIADGQLLRRVRDEGRPENMWKPCWTWQPVEMPSETDRH